MVEQTTQQTRVVSLQAGPDEVDAGAVRYSTGRPHTNNNTQSRRAEPHATNVESGVPKTNSEKEDFVWRIMCT